MITVRCAPWTYEDKVVLIGDSAHAIVPSYGQGANSGFEDCSMLANCILDCGDDWREVFSRFEAQRKPNADAIGELALQHFHELRDLVGDREFQLRKKVELRLSVLYPNRYIPLYNLISFTNVSYVDALEKEHQQRTLLDRGDGEPRPARAPGTRRSRGVARSSAERSDDGVLQPARSPVAGCRDRRLLLNPQGFVMVYRHRP